MERLDWRSPLLIGLAVVYLAAPYFALAALLSGSPLLLEWGELERAEYRLYAWACGGAGLCGLGLSVLTRHERAVWFFGGTTLFFAIALGFSVLI